MTQELTQEASDALPDAARCKTASELKILRSDVACKIDPGDGLSIPAAASWHGKQLFTVQL